MPLAVCLVLALGTAVDRAWAQDLPVELREIATAGKLIGPNFFALTLDAAGNVYVGGANSNNVLRIAPPGYHAVPTPQDCVAELVNPAKAKEAGFIFAAPKGVRVASDGTVYVVATGGAPNLNDGLSRILTDGTITELVDRQDLGVSDWNPAGLTIDEDSDAGVFVYAAGPAAGGLVRVSPDLTFERILTTAGQDIEVDEAGNLYHAQTGDDLVYEIPDARSGVCGVAGKQCFPLIQDGETSCSGKKIVLDGPYALALAGGILYVTGQNSDNVVRRALRPDNALGLPLCAEEIFSTGTAGLVLRNPRALAADSAGNVYAAGNGSDNVIWIRPHPAGVIPQQIISHDNGLAGPEALAVDTQGNVYVSGNLTSNVFRIRTVTAGQACGNGRLDTGEACDYLASCCCSVSCTLQEPRGSCRGAAGECDVDDVCDGVHAGCFDARQETSAVCRPAHGLCDVAEKCDGRIICPDDGFQPSGTECRAATGVCDVAESCTGTGPDCPLDGVLPLDTVCRESTNTCDLVERCDGVSALCPENVSKGPQVECTLTKEDIGGAEVACLEESGRCRAEGACQPVPAIGKVCVPTGLLSPDKRCVETSSCNASGRCEVVLKPDGEQCGNFCDNKECLAGDCVDRPEPHPCGGSDLEHCDSRMLGHECRLCGNGVVEPFEQCDDGNLSGGDGCTEQCKLSCSPDDPCTQPVLDGKVPDPCRRSDCLPVNLDPTIENEGSTCVTVALDCTGCVSDRECISSDGCKKTRCEANRCVNEDKLGHERAACAFTDPFPGAQGPCAPSSEKNKPKTLRGISKLEGAARDLLEHDLCGAGADNPKAGVMRETRHLLRRAVFRANALRTPFREKITQECSVVLTARFERILANLKAAKDSGWSCPTP